MVFGLEGSLVHMIRDLILSSYWLPPRFRFPRTCLSVRHVFYLSSNDYGGSCSLSHPCLARVISPAISDLVLICKMNPYRHTEMYYRYFKLDVS
jgi:hypothetical protein